MKVLPLANNGYQTAWTYSLTSYSSSPPCWWYNYITMLPLLKWAAITLLPFVLLAGTHDILMLHCWLIIYSDWKAIFIPLQISIIIPTQTSIYYEDMYTLQFYWQIQYRGILCNVRCSSYYPCQSLVQFAYATILHDYACTDAKSTLLMNFTFDNKVYECHTNLISMTTKASDGYQGNSSGSFIHNRANLLQDF